MFDTKAASEQEEHTDQSQVPAQNESCTSYTVGLSSCS